MIEYRKSVIMGCVTNCRVIKCHPIVAASAIGHVMVDQYSRIENYPESLAAEGQTRGRLVMNLRARTR
jgi:hypothetical protein